MTSREQVEQIRTHYEQVWGESASINRWRKGAWQQLPVDFAVLEFAPSSKHAYSLWSYGTCGMSLQLDSTPLELHLLSPDKTEEHLELLTFVAHYHLTGAYLDVGHTVNFGRPWLPGSECDHGLVSVPYLDGPKLEWLSTPKGRIRFLWLIPITPQEAQFAKSNGLEALERRFEDRNFNYANPYRASVV